MQRKLIFDHAGQLNPPLGLVAPTFLECGFYEGEGDDYDKEQAVDKEGSDTESTEAKVTANGGEQNGNTPKVCFHSNNFLEKYLTQVTMVTMEKWWS